VAFQKPRRKSDCNLLILLSQNERRELFQNELFLERWIAGYDSVLHKMSLTNGGFEIEADDIQYVWTPLPSLSTR
jgi:hypothetical protein